MDIIYMLIPIMLLLGLVMLGILVWAIRSGQYDDLKGDASRILMDDDDPLLPKNMQPSNTATNGQPTAKREPVKHAGKNWPDAD